MTPSGFLVIGVSGAGKSSLGRQLARKLGWDFLDADDFHPPQNIAKMAAGIPLTDSDRVPWLAMLNDQLLSAQKTGMHLVLGCSALKEKYRLQLLEGMEGIALIYLKGTYDLIWSRMSEREQHFMKPELLQSQFLALEEPRNALILDISLPLEEMIDKILHYYSDSEESIT